MLGKCVLQSWRCVGRSLGRKLEDLGGGGRVSYGVAKDECGIRVLHGEG